jgi:hypothetical protein
LHAEVCAVDGSFAVSTDQQGPISDAKAIGITAADDLLRRDARRALATMPPTTKDVSGS